MQESGPGSTRLPIARRAHKKSKAGCRTCRDRRVKCDERRPLCRKCEQHYNNIVACDFDGQERVLRPAVQLSANQDGRAESSAQAASRQRTASARAVQGNDPVVGRQAEQLRLPQTIDPGRIDPFESRPQSDQPAPTVDALIGHYLADFAYRSFPFYASRSLIEIWWPFVRNDRLLFHCVLLVSSRDREQLQNLETGQQTRRLMGQCLTDLQIRVRDSVTGTNDHTLVAIAMLAALEHDRGDFRALGMHVDGLRRVVQLRGGLDAIRRTNAMAANFVFWCAMVAINEPSLLPLSFGNDNEEVTAGTDDNNDGLDPTIATLLTHDGGETDLRDFGVDATTAKILHEVQRLSRLYTSTLEYQSPQEAVHVLSYLCSILSRLLQLSSSSSPSNRQLLPGPGLAQSCRLTACLHLFTPLSGYFPNPELMLQNLTRSLKGSLAHDLRASNDATQGSSSSGGGLMLWLLSVGGISAHAMPERAWFVGHLVVVATSLGIRDWPSMRQHLVKLAFHDNFCDLSFHSLWNEIRKKQEALSVGPEEEDDAGSGRTNDGGFFDVKE